MLLVLNVLVAILVVLFYSAFVEPGRSREFYEAAATRIAPWCSHIAGTAFFFCAGYLFTARKRSRNGFLFAAAFTVFYAIIDSATVGFTSAFEIELLLSTLAKLAASLAGAYLATRRTSHDVKHQ